MIVTEATDRDELLRLWSIVDAKIRSIVTDDEPVSAAVAIAATYELVGEAGAVVFEEGGMLTLSLGGLSVTAPAVLGRQIMDLWWIGARHQFDGTLSTLWGHLFK